MLDQILKGSYNCISKGSCTGEHLTHQQQRAWQPTRAQQTSSLSEIHSTHTCRHRHYGKCGPRSFKQNTTGLCNYIQHVGVARALPNPKEQTFPIPGCLGFQEPTLLCPDFHRCFRSSLLNRSKLCSFLVSK